MAYAEEGSAGAEAAIGLDPASIKLIPISCEVTLEPSSPRETSKQLDGRPDANRVAVLAVDVLMLRLTACEIWSYRQVVLFEQFEPSVFLRLRPFLR